MKPGGRRRAECRLPLVTGAEGAVRRLHPIIRGAEGAQSSGAPLVSFNLDAFSDFDRLARADEPGRLAPIPGDQPHAVANAASMLRSLALCTTRRPHWGKALRVHSLRREALPSASAPGFGLAAAAEPSDGLRASSWRIRVS